MILLRHCQSEFNLHFTRTRRDPGIVDPVLTELGLQQADAAAEALAGEPIRRIVASPYRRALQTAAPLARRLGVPVEIEPLVRERFAFVCDVGSPRSALEALRPDLDFSALDEEWWPGVVEDEAGVLRRAALFRQAMAARPDWRETLVVSHWGFLLALSGRSLENGRWIRLDPTQPPPDEIIWKH